MATTVYPMSGTNQGDSGQGDSSGGTDYSGLLRRLAAYFTGASSANLNQNNLLDQRRQSQWKEVEDARLARDKFSEAVPGQRMSTSLRASLLNGWSPTTVNWGGPGSGKKGQIPTYTGGLEGGIEHMDPRTRQLNDTVMSQELDRQTANKDDILSKPPALGDESALDKLLGGAASGSSLLDALAGGPSSGGNVVSLIKDLLKRRGGMNDNGDLFSGLPSYDPYDSNNPDNFTGNPSDASGGTGVGPGMQDFYKWLRDQEQNGGTGGNEGPTGTDSWDE